MKRIFFSVGEPSGDLHGSNLIRRLKTVDPSIDCVGFGGPKMETAGLDLHYDLTQHAVMLLTEIIKKLRFFFSLVDRAEEYFVANQVDAVVLIDYPGFNWHIAKRAKKLGIPVFYYGVPQMWAWAPWRIRKARRLIDHVLCKLPFEKKWFEDRGCSATYVGHPFFDQLTNQQYDQQFIDSVSATGHKTAQSSQALERSEKQMQPGQLLLLLPGSRSKEVRDNLPMMMRSAELCQSENPGLRVAIGCFNQKHYEFAQTLVQESGLNCELYVERTPELMKLADVCIACSGSVSLELMFHRLPTVIVYKVSKVIRCMEKVLIRARYITLVNLLESEKLSRDGIRTYDPDAKGAVPLPMPEYLTSSDRSPQIAVRIGELLNDAAVRESTIARLDELARKYGEPGASERAANYIAECLGMAADSRASAA